MTARRATALLAPLARDRRLAPGRVSGTFDTVLFHFARKHPRDGVLIDIFSNRVLDEPAIGRLLVVDNSLPFAHKDGIVLCSRDYYMAQAVAGAAMRMPFLLPQVRALNRELDRCLQHEMGLHNPMSALHVATRLGVFLEGRRIARRLLAAAKPNRFMFVNSTWAQPFCAAAIDLGVPAIELQHGVISPFHSPYHYPGRPVVPYAPDVFLTFGRFWSEAVDLPRNTRVSVIGSGDLQRYTPRAGAPKKRQVFVASQGTVAQQLVALTAEIAKRAPDWTFVYRAHPLQDSTQALPAFPSNVELAPPPTDPYERLLESDVQIGVYSTLLFEGMAFGARTIVLDLPGVEHMRPVIDRGDAVLARTAEEAVAYLQTAPKSGSTDRYYAPPVPSLLDAITSAT